MLRAIPFLLSLLTPLFGVPQDPRADQAAQVEAVIAEYDAAYARWYDAYIESQGANADELPGRRPYALRLLEVARRSPASDAAFRACAWTLEPGGEPETMDAALELLAEHHARRGGIEEIALTVRGGSAAANRFLAAVEGGIESTEDRGRICYELARGSIRALWDPHLSAEERARFEALAERCLARCADEFALVPVPRPGEEDAPPTLRARSQRDVFELRHLTPGKPAFEIRGEDLAGEAFTLSEQRGKVVMLDFWGHW